MRSPTTRRFKFRHRPRPCRSRFVWGRNKIAPNVIWYANFRAVPGGSGKGVGGKGGALGGGGCGQQLHLHRRPHHGAVRGADHGIGLVWKDLSSMSRSSSALASSTARRRKTSGHISRRSTHTTLLPIRGQPTSGRPATTSATRPRSATTISRSSGLSLAPASIGDDADPALVIHDFLTNAQYGVGFDPASIDSGSLFTNPDSFRPIAGRWAIAFSPVLCQPGAGLEHPDALAANLLDCAPCGAAACSSSSPTATPRSPRDTRRLTAHNSRSRFRSRPRRASTLPALSSPSAAPSAVRFGRRRRLCVFRHPASLSSAPIFRASLANTACQPAGTYIFGSRRPGQAGRHHLHGRGGWQLHAQPDAGLRSHRSDFIDEKGNKDPVSGRARRRLLAADHPAHRSV